MATGPLETLRDQAALTGSGPRRPHVAEKTNWRAALFFLLPAALLIIVFLIYPTIYTVLLSFNRGRRGEFTQWVGLDNYVQLFTLDPDFLLSIRNNVLWIVFYVSLTVFLGLIIAVIAGRVRYEAVVKAIVFIPMAIAATALAVAWRFVYYPDSNTGLLNAVLGVFHVGPIPWLGDQGIVNFALIAVGIWASTGFATVILSAALKSIPTEIIEAARTDGANERQIFLRIIVPMVSLPMSVLAVTLVVNVIKLFDLVYVMTAGGPGSASRVIAFEMFQVAFPGGQLGKGAAIAVVMLLILIPIMVFNVRRFRTQAVT